MDGGMLGMGAMGFQRHIGPCTSENTPLPKWGKKWSVRAFAVSFQSLTVVLSPVAHFQPPTRPQVFEGPTRPCPVRCEISPKSQGENLTSSCCWAMLWMGGLPPPPFSERRQETVAQPEGDKD
uniref:Uncharacterized protein n=1 Tax=Eutreptiella gymnastica TaxID=73025 RepID=A0A7S4CUH8_9EUGL|eukprot:CAMPEP_0174380870 /NCGR_PEP_ID=MMETSP0811_2-20130205/123646_1 /TAXON_ID=73025 ORGANISM="Eutreptiella gymnastica-like, Strain CCMP1594" /NCGR_SAMPLE_ID=MMETSP0811_2 /ASSEMBLY_ACC=CAM_ASM_000667 /LENGTH=122 /DNA_ID=CAMNT_0015533845 /DNA_START=545 /DNA_END=913 /DNA_ORIENTATION=-